MTSTITEHGEARTRQYGAFTITAQLAVDGYAVNTFQGPNRVPALCIALSNADDANAVYRAIRDGGTNGKTAEAVADDVREALVRAAAPMRGRAGYAPRVAELDRALDQVEPLADAALFAPAAPVVDQPRTFRDLRDAYAVDLAR